MQNADPVSDGGPAFPQAIAFNRNGEAVYSGMYFQEGPGMSLRDWFAGMALQGIMNNTNAFANMSDKAVAENCWKAADAMLAARKRKEPQP